jgi:hypothetical protein
MGEVSNACRMFVVEPEGNRPLGRPRPRRMDIVKRDARYDRVMWTGLVWLIETSEVGNKPSGSIQCWDAQLAASQDGFSSMKFCRKGFIDQYVSNVVIYSLYRMFVS